VAKDGRVRPLQGSEDPLLQGRRGAGAAPSYAASAGRGSKCTVYSTSTSLLGKLLMTLT